MKRIIVFKYKEGWMVLLYDGIKNTKYWYCDEDYWDDVWEYIKLLKEYEKIEEMYLTFKSYDEVCNLNLDIFSLTEEDFELLKKYR